MWWVLDKRGISCICLLPHYLAVRWWKFPEPDPIRSVSFVLSSSPLPTPTDNLPRLKIFFLINSLYLSHPNLKYPGGGTQRRPGRLRPTVCCALWFAEELCRHPAEHRCSPSDDRAQKGGCCHQWRMQRTSCCVPPPS